MIAAALLLALAQGAPNARWEIARAPLEPASFEVGVPFTATLVVEHAPGAAVEVDFSAVEADLGWLLAGEPRLVRAGGASATSTSWTCSLAALEPGARALPSPSVAITERGGERAAGTVAPAEIELSGALAPGEDAPREPKGFRPAGPAEDGLGLRWIAAIAALVLAAVGIVAWLATRRRAAPAKAPGALERLDALAARDLDDPRSVRELHYELTAIVRSRFDALDGLERDALTDDEWVAAVAPLRPGAAEELRELMRAADAVKYGPERPTQWAVQERIGLARKLVQGGSAVGAGAPAAVPA